MDELEAIWPDEDRRNGALERLATTINNRRYDELSPDKLLILQCCSHGLGLRGTADVTGFSYDHVKQSLWRTRRIMAVKDNMQAVAEGLRRGLIT